MHYWTRNLNYGYYSENDDIPTECASETGRPMKRRKVIKARTAVEGGKN